MQQQNETEQNEVSLFVYCYAVQPEHAILWCAIMFNCCNAVLPNKIYDILNKATNLNKTQQHIPHW
jgi:hypothetical protein